VTAHELIAAIEGAGGALHVTPDGQRLRCKVPRQAGWLIELARKQRDELKAALLSNGCTTMPDQNCGVPDLPQFRNLLARWLADHTVRSSRYASNHASCFVSFHDSQAASRPPKLCAYYSLNWRRLASSAMEAGWWQASPSLTIS
jgi:hypothetical protein